MHALRLDKTEHSMVIDSNFFGRRQTYFANERLTFLQLKDEDFR
jgi:hypothetical protein